MSCIHRSACFTSQLCEVNPAGSCNSHPPSLHTQCHQAGLLQSTRATTKQQEQQQRGTLKHTHLPHHAFATSCIACRSCTEKSEASILTESLPSLHELHAEALWKRERPSF